MRALDLIHAKRLGQAHTNDELRFLIQNYAQGAIPDYQMSAWLMAALWRGLSEDETFALTDAMIASGDQLDLSSLPGIPVDKHSTGGVGDKTTLAVVPILASAGVPVAKMSGRGLGHTGGTLDKLESIPGTQTALSTEEILAQVKSIGACICAQTDRLVPADHKLYALRDSTDTVESLPLIAASIMSKKIASGSKALVLDVKVGGGAFMKTLDEGRALAALMIRIGQAHGQRVVAALSDMNRPLGYAVGNLVEVGEIVALLQNEPETEPRLKALVRYLSALGFLLAERVESVEEGEALADQQIESGAAFDKLSEIVAAQGGDGSVLSRLQSPPRSKVMWEARAMETGIVHALDAQALGQVAMRLGAGRETKDDHINPAAGIILCRTVGQTVARGDLLAALYTDDEARAQQAAPVVQDAFTLSNRPFEETPLIYETLGLDAE